MKKWTKQAEDRLAEYFEARQRCEGLSDADAREMKEDLTAHFHEEAEQISASEISTTEFDQLLNTFGDSQEGQVSEAEDFSYSGLWWFGVIIPVVIILLEKLTHFCGSVFFDPMPTWWHFIILAAVPFSHAWLLKRGRFSSPRKQGFAVGMAFAISTIYALLFIPLAPLSAIALIFLGLGFLSLAPLFIWIANRRISRLMQQRVTRPWQFRRGWLTGTSLTAVLFLILEGPSLWTRWHLDDAVSKEPEVAEAGLKKLRFFHSERTLLQACYEGNRGTSMGTDLSGWFRSGWNIPLAFVGQHPSPINSEKVRETFFRVTGRPFNSQRPPTGTSGNFLVGSRGLLADMEFDDHLGGDEVAVRLRDLDLKESRFDGHIDTMSQLGYGEWTMVFQNASSQPKEARCKVRLPRGGRVSRLTLWVNGEPREAAFNTVAKVKKAYRSVAVVQRKDPVLVTMAGPDTIMVQCFPVPAEGEMKIRFGVTAPLDGGYWDHPRIVERNFGVLKECEHALWLQANEAFEVPELLGSREDGEGYSVQQSLPFHQFLQSSLALNFPDAEFEPDVVWCEDPFARGDEKYLQRTTRFINQKPVDRLVIVIDGSQAMAQEADVLSRLFRVDFPELEVLIADDGVSQIRDLSSYQFSGGRDNEPALRKALSLAKDAKNGAVLWLHGPQAVKLNKTEAIVQLMERGTRRPKLYEIEVASGPNRLAELLGNRGILERGPTMHYLKRDLKKFIEHLLRGSRAPKTEWLQASRLQELEGQKVWDQLARSWAVEKSESGDPAGSAIAAQYQLVTPVSGAVVLETMEQFKEHGLTPVDVMTTPTIPAVPEPSTALLILCGLLTVFHRRRTGFELSGG